MCVYYVPNLKFLPVLDRRVNIQNGIRMTNSIWSVAVYFQAEKDRKVTD